MERKGRLVLLMTILCAPMISAVLIEGFVAFLVGGYLAPKLYCHFSECCKNKWIKPNITGLQSALRRRVFGQHLVTETVFKALVGHLNNKSPNKALAISFNGWTGSGKNFVSKIIAEHIFKKGLESDYVNLIIATHEYPHQSQVEFYKRQLRNRVESSVSKCPRSLFIFDEMDKMPIGLIDVLKPFLDHYPPDEGKIDYRQSIFIFLSNTGGNLINNAVLKHWKDGKKRGDIKIKDMDKVINLGEFNNKGGFWHSSLIDKNLIDYFIPFMPMERSHVKKCAKADLEKKGHPVTDSILNRVADELLYFPEDLKVFSLSGCKKVSSKVDYVMG
nr:torsin-1A-like [Pocillopora verrucosa]